MYLLYCAVLASIVLCSVQSGLQHVLDAARAKDPRGGTEEERGEAAEEAVKEGQKEWEVGGWWLRAGGDCGGRHRHRHRGWG